MMIKILLVEDEPVLAAIVKESLETRGFDVRVAANGVEGWTLFNEVAPDVCVVDIMLPRKNGFSLVKDIRTADAWVPIIFLTARTQLDDVLKGLELGADDYMKKPFSMEELVLRLKALVRRKPANAATQTLDVSAPVSIGRFHFNYAELGLSDGVHVFQLSQREGDLLDLLVQHKNRLLDRKAALLKLWGDDSPFNTRSMDVYITRLRKFLKNDPALEIINTRGKGYTLIDRSASTS